MASWFVDNAAGNDANAGTSTSAPFRHCPGDADATGNAASCTPAAGDVVNFKGGVTYRGQIQVKSSGASGSPILYDGNSGWGTGKAILDGSTVLTGWALHAGNVYSVDAPSGYNFWVPVFEDDTILDLSQYPKQTEPFFIDDLDDFATIPAAELSRLTTTTLVDTSYFTQADPSYWVGAYALIWCGPNIVVPTLITAYDPATHKITFNDVGQTLYTGRDVKWSVVNHPDLITQAGEYAYRGGKIYAWLRNPGMSEISVGSKQWVFNIYQKSYITIDGFIAQKCVGLDNEYNLGSPVVVGEWENAPWDTHHIVVRDVESRLFRSYEGAPGISVRFADTVLIDNCTVHDCQMANGIKADDGSTNVTIQNCDVYRAGYTGIWMKQVTGGVIYNNKVHDLYATHGNGISVYQSCNGVVVAKNRVYDVGGYSLTLSASANLYFLNNVLLNQIGEWGSESSGLIYFLNNLMLSSETNTLYVGGDSAGSTATYRVLNNVISGGGFGSTCNSTIDHRHNIYTALRWDQSASDFGVGESQQALSSLLTVGVDGAFTLAANSPVIGAGLDVSSYFPPGWTPEQVFGDSGYLSGGGAWMTGAYQAAPSVGGYAVLSISNAFLVLGVTP